MPIPPKSGPPRRLLIPALLLSATAPAQAQAPVAAAATTQVADPAELLAQALRTLATEPRNLPALMAAGHNALTLGDPNAAVGFFGRAQEIAPNDGRVKAGLGSALVQLEKPQDALRLFGEASRLGVPDADIAEDRGLAYDLTGDQRRAQADYQTVVLAHPEDDTARRRLALSQGISGQKTAAITTLDPLIRKRDIAGWRAQTFVLAMNGDSKGANDITRIMLPQQAAMLQPFLVRLATLSPADKARAVHFGEMPSGGASYTPTQVASVDAPATYAARPAPVPKSDLAPMPARGVTPAPTPAQVSPAPPPVAKPPVQIATVPQGAPATVSAQSTPAPTLAPTGAPLAGIALTPAPAVTTTAPAQTTPSPSQPAPQLAQMPPPSTGPAGPPAPVLAMPTPAAQGHYDLPHDAASKAPIRVTRAAPAPVKTIGTPVVHGTPGKVEPAVNDAVPTPVSAKKPAKTELASTDEKPAKPVAKALDDTADTKPAKTKKAAPAGDTAVTAISKTKTASADEDCAPVRTIRSKAHAKAKSASTPCTKLAVGDEDTPPAKAKKSTKLASADDDATPAKTKKGAKAKPTADDEVTTPSKASKLSKSAKVAAEKAGAERVYVQVAGGANKDDMNKAWAGVKKKAPELMKGHTPSTTPLKSTNRLLVGPFKDEAEAQAFVNKMAAKGLSGFTFKSARGQKVDKVDAGG